MALANNLRSYQCEHVMVKDKVLIVMLTETEIDKDNSNVTKSEEIFEH